MARRTRALTKQIESNGSATANGTAARTRRFHTKSRNGCTECKQRHIRCDERQPSCANCEAAERVCVFPTPKGAKVKQKQGQRYHATQQHRHQTTAAMLPGFEGGSHNSANTSDNADGEHAPLPSSLLQQRNNHLDLGQAPDQPSWSSLPTPNPLSFITGFDVNPYQTPCSASSMQPSDIQTPPANCCPGLSPAPDAVPEAIFTPQHMILLHHSYAVPNVTGPKRSAVDIAICHAINSPYLLDEVLAFTAFHMASLYPGSAVHLQRLATELQTRALATFTRLTESLPHDDKATAVPRFLFSAILGRHVLADTLTYCRSDFYFFIDRFVECVNLNRGIRAVTPPAWEYLRTTELLPFLTIFREAEEKIISPGNECDPLSRLMDDSDLSETSVQSCRQAIEVLQRSFDVCHGLEEEEYPQAVSAFSVKIKVGFVDVLRKHRPEALVILAYYGVLLHRCRSFWPFGDAGASIIHAIAEHLGMYWQAALAWPLHVLETERRTGGQDKTPRS